MHTYLVFMQIEKGRQIDRYRYNMVQCNILDICHLYNTIEEKYIFIEYKGKVCFYRVNKYLKNNYFVEFSNKMYTMGTFFFKAEKIVILKKIII